MKKIIVLILLMLILIGCKNANTVKTDLEAEGWMVTIIDEESLDQWKNILGPEIIDTNVKTILMGFKNLKTGFVIEFDRYKDARSYYNNLKEDRSDVYRRGKLIVITDSVDFLKIVIG